MYINGSWIRHATIPSYLSSYSVSDEIEGQIDNELLSILDKARIQVKTKANVRIQNTNYFIGTLAESALNTSVQPSNVNFVRNLVSKFGCIRDTSEVGTTLGEFIRFQVNTILCMIVAPTEEQTHTYRLTIIPGKLGLPDSSYYLDKTPEKEAAIVAYMQLLSMLGEDFNVSSIETVLGLERIAAESIRKGRDDLEVLVRGADLIQMYPNIPWSTLVLSSLKWPMSKFRSHSILITSKTWMKQVNKWFRLLSIPIWKTWLSVNMLLHCLPLLPAPYDTMDFELYGHKLRGQSEKVPQQRLALHLTEKWLSSSLGELFIHSYVPHSVKLHVLEIAREIRRVASEVVASTEWLHPITRKKAKIKVQSLYLSVAYPSTFRKDKGIVLHPEHLVQNIFTLAEADFVRELEKVNKQLDNSQWDDDVFAVNAYYYNEGNRLILPSGILRWPFFHVKASDGWNFGGLGATIGHEICHAFDEDGKEYDEYGNKNPWWSKQETGRFLEKTRALVQLFDKTLYFGQHINGALTSSENIADLAGLSIALNALKQRLQRKHVSPPVYGKELRDFFISYATSWRTKEKKQKAIQSIFMDVHAPPLARVNNIVCQFDDWYECFNVQPGDVLYKSPEERIRIF